MKKKENRCLKIVTTIALGIAISGCGNDESVTSELAEMLHSDPDTEVAAPDARCMADQIVKVLGEDTVSDELELNAEDNSEEFVEAVVVAYEDCIGFEALFNESGKGSDEVAREEKTNLPALGCDSPQVIAAAEELGLELVLHDVLGGREAVERLKSMARKGGTTETEIDTEFANIAKVESLHNISDYGIDPEINAIRCEGDLLAKSKEFEWRHNFKFEYIVGTSSTGDPFVRGVSLSR